MIKQIIFDDYELTTDNGVLTATITFQYSDWLKLTPTQVNEFCEVNCIYDHSQSSPIIKAKTRNNYIIRTLTTGSPFFTETSEEPEPPKIEPKSIKPTWRELRL